MNRATFVIAYICLRSKRDTYTMAIHRVLLRLDYEGPTSTIEFDFRMILMHDQSAMRYTDFQQQRLNQLRWIAYWISYFSDDAPGIEGKREIKEAIIPFAKKIQWAIMCFRLSPKVSDNVLTQERDPLAAILLMGHEIDLVALIRMEIHAYQFSETKPLPFKCLIQ